MRYGARDAYSLSMLYMRIQRVGRALCCWNCRCSLCGSAAVQEGRFRSRTTREASILLAELSLARDTVVVPVHFGAGAVAQEEGGLFAGAHLRTMRAAVVLVLGLAGRDAASNINITRAWFAEELDGRGLLLPSLIGGVGLPGAYCNQCVDDQSKQDGFLSYLNEAHPSPCDLGSHFSVRDVL